MAESRPPNAQEAPIIAQVAGIAVAEDAARRAASVGADVVKQDAAFAAALHEVAKVREFVGTPTQILGNPSTKHGEIAETIEVGIRRARHLLQGAVPSAWKHSDRTGAVDYIIDGDHVQSKFINGVRNTLDHVREHMERYPRFGRDGSYYHIPRDQFEVIQKALRGEGHPELSDRVLARIAEKAREIQQLSGSAELDTVVKPGISDYADVQQGRVHSTLEAHERDLSRQNDELRSDILGRQTPSLGGAAGAAGKGIAAGAAIRLVTNVYDNYRAGKRIWKGAYSVADWKQLGVDVGEGALLGGISAAAIYGLTNYADLAAPFAGAVVSSALSITALLRRYRNGELSFDEFCELGQIACLEGAAVGLATAVGQAVVPVPVLGSLLGAAAGRLLVAISKDALATESQRLQARLRLEYEDGIRELDEASRTLLASVLARYDELGDLLSTAFDFDANAKLRFLASVELAREHCVSEDQLLTSTAQVDTFMLT